MLDLFLDSHTQNGGPRVTDRCAQAQRFSERTLLSTKVCGLIEIRASHCIILHLNHLAQTFCPPLKIGGCALSIGLHTIKSRLELGFERGKIVENAVQRPTGG